MRRLILGLTMIFLIYNAYASLMLGTDCPNSVYAHELFDCKIYVSTTGESADVKLYPHSADGLFTSLLPELQTSIRGVEIKVLEVNLWALDAGTDALVVDAVSDVGEKLAALSPIKIVNPPITVKYPTLTTSAGKREEFAVKIIGSALNVRVWLESPSSSIQVSGPTDLGDVSETDRVELYLIPSPDSFGSYTVYLYVSFMDDSGIHVLRYPIDVWVNPSFYTVGLFLGALFLVVLLVYWVYRRAKEKKSKETSANEAQ